MMMMMMMMKPHAVDRRLEYRRMSSVSVYYFIGVVAAILTTSGDAFFCFGFIVTTRLLYRATTGTDARRGGSARSPPCLQHQQQHANRHEMVQRDVVIPDGLNSNTKATIFGSIAKGERRARERSVCQRRQLCDRCHRPPVQCVCASLPIADTTTNSNNNKIVTPHTDLLILQHPAEFRRQTFSTVPLVLLVLQNAQVFVGHSFDLQIPPIQKAIQENRQLLLLYPGTNAVDLNNDPAALQRLLQGIQTKQSEKKEAVSIDDNRAASEERSLNSSRPKNLLILVDGTWTQAQRLVTYSPDLVKACQQVQFTSSDVTSIYNAVRKEPYAHCLSTLEAIAQALFFLESPNVASLASHHLYAALQSLVNIQLQYSSASHADPSWFHKQRAKKGEQRKQRRLQLEDELFGESVTSNANPHKNDNHNTTFRQVPNEKATSSIGTLDPKPTIDRAMSMGTTDNDIPTTISIVLKDGSTLRPLKTRDAPFIDSRWPHRSKKSLSMISHRLILANIKTNHHQPNCCLGIYGPDVIENERGDKDDDACNTGTDSMTSPSSLLRAFILRYEDGSLGMLHVEEAHRRKGYGSLLLQHATQQIRLAARAQQGYCDARVVASAFILDGNTASEGLFTKQGWKRDEDPAGLKKRGTGKRRAKRKWIKELNLLDC